MRSVKTTFRILDAVADLQPVGLSDLARKLDLPKATVQRSLATLAEVGWIRSDGSSSTRWVLSEHSKNFGQRSLADRQLREVAVPVLARLNSETLETVHLMVPDGHETVLLERIDSPHPLRAVRPVGTRAPLHATSNGKAMLAHFPPDEIEEYIAAGLTAVTAHTITDPGLLREELELTRSRGYAIAHDEAADGVSSVAASIRPHGGRPVASMSISGPSIRVNETVFDKYGHLIDQAAHDVAETLAAPH